jgi:hypothetical protein
MSDPGEARPRVSLKVLDQRPSGLSQPAGEPPLPEVFESVLSWATLDDLLRDISVATEVLGIMVKGHPLAHAGHIGADLAAARSALRDGSAIAVQIRYRHQGAEWRDTLMRVGNGVRVVRIQQ